MADHQTDLEKLFSEGSGDPQRRQRPRRKRKTLRNWLIVLGSLIALIGIGIGIAFAVVNNSYNEITRVEAFDPKLERPAEVPVKEGENAPINFLLLGSDSRQATDQNTAAGDLTGFRSDAIMVAQVSADRQNVTIMSIMRDNWVGIEGHGEAKINAAFSFGGLPLAVNTVENFIGARIDHVAIVDFESFKGLTDAVGGVTLNNDIAFNSHHGNFDFAEGSITLNGEQALSFVRERYAFADGDYQRVRNQQAYMKGLIGAILSRDTLGDIGKVTSLFDALKPYLILDSELDLGTAASLGLEMKDIRPENMSFFTSPTLGTGASEDGQSIVRPNWDALAEVQAAFQNGTLHEYAAAIPVVSG